MDSLQDAPTAPWLSVEEQQVWRAFLKGTARISTYLDEDLRGFGLDLPEYEILAMLSEAPERRLRMSELATAVNQSRSRLTHTVTRLERQGHVARTTCSNDGRGVWAQLTESGYELLVASAPRHVAAVRRILVDAVGPTDLAALGRAMSRVLAVAD